MRWQEGWSLWGSTRKIEWELCLGILLNMQLYGWLGLFLLRRDVLAYGCNGTVDLRIVQTGGYTRMLLFFN